MDETVNTPFHKDEDIMELMEMLRSFKERENIHKLGEASGKCAYRNRCAVKGDADRTYCGKRIE